MLLIYATEKICDRICVVPNHETHKKANITAHEISKIRSMIIIILLKRFDYRSHIVSSKDKILKRLYHFPDTLQIFLDKGGVNFIVSI